MAMIAVVLGCGSTMAADSSAAADWPQWRGPNRDGVVQGGPKLLNAWPTNGTAGPKLLWKSESIPSGTKGGAGSVTVAGGKAFVFVHAMKAKGKVVLTAKDVADLGWMDGVPDDLIKKIDDSIRSEKWRQLKPGPDMDAYIKAFTATLDPKQAETFGAFIHKRMNQQPLNWDGLARLANIRDKEIPGVDNLRDFIRIGVHESVYDGAYQTARAMLNEKYAGYLDTVVCLDAATGKDLWRKSFPGALSKQAEYWGASSTPAVWDGKCYVTGSAGLYCLNVKDGSVVWQSKTKFSNSSPLVANGVVYSMVPELTAFDAMIRTIMQAPQIITLISIGPLSNIAAALKREPCIAAKCRFVGMHGSIYRRHDGQPNPVAEYNVVADIPASQAVFSAPWHSMVITPLDTCGVIRLTGAKYETVKSCKDPLTAAVIENYRIWSWVGDQFPIRSSILFDTVAIYLAFSEKWLRMQDMQVTVDHAGFTRINPEGQWMRVAIDWEDLGAFEDFLVARLTKS